MKAMGGEILGSRQAQRKTEREREAEAEADLEENGAIRGTYRSFGFLHDTATLGKAPVGRSCHSNLPRQSPLSVPSILRSCSKGQVLTSDYCMTGTCYVHQVHLSLSMDVICPTGAYENLRSVKHLHGPSLNAHMSC